MEPRGSLFGLPPHHPPNALIHTYLPHYITETDEGVDGIPWPSLFNQFSSVYLYDKCVASSSLHEVVQGGWRPLNGVDIPLHSVL